MLVLANDPEMASMLSQSFALGRIRKIYFGISAKKTEKEETGMGYWWNGAVRSRRETWMLTKESPTPILPKPGSLRPV
jgi:23S rRNA-/tRNA-specific pseudouridylate synthase